jgi:Peptidase C13 family
MGHWRWLCGVGLGLLLTACLAAEGDAKEARAAPPVPPAGAQPAGWKAVLIAGDDAEPAFDNAVDAMAEKLARFGLTRHDISILKSSGIDAAAATRANVEAAFAALAPGPYDGCFVFVTSHGAPRRGLVVKRARGFLTPGLLDHLLDQGCRLHPTVVIASGCYSGIFAHEPPMPAANRTILTAARADRPSFGCNAHRVYTVFDECVLASLDRGESWRRAMDKTRACVSGNEFELGVKRPSEPQLSIGAAEKALRVFAR